jgi:selenocysteine-specific elongation factor
MEHPFVFGTAGHIDHGKTALVRALTGIDCDRLEEEKRRGITIELGFAPLTLPCGKTVSIVDVPGHERFIRRMAAGACGVDAAILVIAATEGVMPQTREHLDVLGLLGVRAGVAVVTKTDLVDAETLSLALEEASEIIRGSCLEGSSIIPASAVSGEGIQLLLRKMEELTAGFPPRKAEGPFFMPIDRVFAKKGLGAVATGTCYAGKLASGGEVEIMCAGIAAKARSLQTHGAEVKTVSAGQRAAVNLSGVSVSQIKRGGAVCARGAFTPSRCMNVSLRALAQAPKGVAHWQRVHLYAGTAEINARVSLLKMEDGKKNAVIAPGEEAPAQLLLEEDAVAQAGQHFVIRFYSPPATIGGGRILLPNAVAAKGRVSRKKKAGITEKLARDSSPQALLAAIIHDRGALNSAVLFKLSQMEEGAFEAGLKALRANLNFYGITAFGAGRNFICKDELERITSSLRGFLLEFHKKNPEAAGAEGEKLYAKVYEGRGAEKAAAPDFKDLLHTIAASGGLEEVEARGKTCYRAAGFTPHIDKKFMFIVEFIQNACEKAGFNFLKADDLREKLSEAGVSVSPAQIKSALDYLHENLNLKTLEGGALFPPRVREEAVKLMASLEKTEGAVTAASLRSAAGINRKHSVAILDFFDAQGVTKRTGDKRILLKNMN